MKVKLRIIGFVILLCAITVVAGNTFSVPQDDRTRQQRNATPQDDKTRNKNKANNKGNDDKKGNSKEKIDIKAQPTLADEDDEIPDSLLHPRWKIQRTQPITDDDLSQGSADLVRPEMAIMAK